MFNLKNYKTIFYQVIKFSIVGIFGVFISYCIFALALIVFKIHYLISGLMSHLLSGIPIFLLHRYWTFKSNISVFKGFVMYLIIDLFIIVVAIFSQYLSKEYLDVPEIYTHAFGLFVAALASFILLRILMKKKF